MIATRGLRQTSTAAQPTAANMPISREGSNWPARRTPSPRRKSVDDRAIETRYVDFGDNGFREHPIQSLRKGNLFPAKRKQLEVPVKAGGCLLAADDLEELLLTGKAGERGFDVGHELGSGPSD